MKNKFLLIPLCFSAIALATGCSNSGNDKFLPSFGSRADTELVDIKYSDLFTKNENEESMLVAIYPGADTTCRCWTTFEIILNNFVNESDVMIYSIDVYEIIDKEEDYGLVLSTSAPSFVFFKEGKKYEQYVYSTKNTQEFFQYQNAFKDFIAERVETPKVLYINEQILETAVNDKKDFIVQHLYHSCPDCSYCLPNVIDPYVRKNGLTNEIWLMDLEVEGLLLVNGKKDNTNPNYVSYKNKYGLSEYGNADYGYVQGKVPTMQVYKKGVLSDANVFFNDGLTYDPAKKIATVTETYYTETRLKKLKYMADVETKILTGITLSGDDIIVHQGNAYWQSKSAAVYHKPILEAFLDYYAK